MGCTRQNLVFINRGFETRIFFILKGIYFLYLKYIFYQYSIRIELYITVFNLAPNYTLSV